MNNNIMKFAIAGITCAVFCGTAVAAPKGNHGGNGRPARTAVPSNASRAAKPPPKANTNRSAPAPRAAKPAHYAHGRGSAPAARPAKPAAPARHAAPVNTVRHRYDNHHHASPPHHASHRRHAIPHGARYWARPPVPLWRVGALRAWEWIEAEWMIFENGVYYYGDGYYYDGYNYYYNGAYHTAPPVTVVFM